MRLEFSKTAATAGLSLAMAARLFFGATLDAPEAANAAWLAVPVALALALPVIWLMCNHSQKTPRWFAALLFAGLALDAADTIEWTAYSESFLSFDHVPPLLLMLPLLLALLRCCRLGGDAVGGAARFHVRLLIILMLVVILYQLPYYKPGWLAPWLGAGFGGVLHAGIRAAGWIALLAGGVVTACREPLGLRDILPGMVLAATSATVLTMLRQMMAPAMTAGHESRAVLIDALLTNGRAPLYLQLPMIIAWLVGMLHLTAFEGVAACALVNRVLPEAKEGVCAAIGLVVVTVLALSRVPRMPAVQQALMYLYHALAVSVMIARLMKGRRTKCATPA